jgi:hypothetical protein
MVYSHRMNMLAWFVQTVLFSVYGIVGSAALLYWVLGLTKRWATWIPDPTYVVVPLALVAIVTVPSIPRYRFESESLATIDASPWIRVVDKTKWGSLTEPLTLLRTPVGFFHLFMPDPMEAGNYREIILRYGEDPRVVLSEPDCTDGTVLRAEADGEGTFRYTSTQPMPMDPAEAILFCNSDWSTERAALRNAQATQRSEIERHTKRVPNRF